jgi:hypothetical protein
MLGDMLQGHHEELLPEALRLLARAGLRLPHALLPAALRVRGDELQAAVRRVLGERGVWLARLNEAWGWAAGASPSASIEQLEATWTDGSAAARRAILARARAVDAERARGWLEAAWSTEKADERAALLSALREGLTGTDEPFLEAQLRDRAAAVREAAQALLGCLIESAFVRRMTERADGMLDFKRSAMALVGKRGALDVRPPEKVDDDADRDGLLAKPPQGVGARAFWLNRAVAAVPPCHWTKRFGATAVELVAAARTSDWAGPLCEGWTRAALLQGDREWLGAVWEFWQQSDEKVAADRVVTTLLVQILQRLPPPDAAALVEALFAGTGGRLDVLTALGALGAPWPANLGGRWLEMMRRELRQMSAHAHAVVMSLRLAALALPPECFPAALEPLDLPGGEGGWERFLGEFTEVLRLRHDLFQEIAP